MCLSDAENIFKTLHENPRRCAIVDCDDGCRVVFGKILSELGFTVSTFVGGEALLDVWPGVNFEVVLLSSDAWMVAGKQVVGMAKDLGSDCPSFIIMCDQGGSFSFASDIVPVGFLFRPCEIKRLIKLLWKAIGE